MHTGNVRKSEWILLGLTGLFLSVLLVLYFHDRTRLDTQSVVTETEVPQEEILPDLLAASTPCSVLTDKL